MKLLGNTCPLDLLLGKGCPLENCVAKNALGLWARMPLRVGKNALRGPVEKADALGGQKAFPLLWLLLAHWVLLRANCSRDRGDCGQKALNAKRFGQGCCHKRPRAN